MLQLYPTHRPISSCLVLCHLSKHDGTNNNGTFRVIDGFLSTWIQDAAFNLDIGDRLQSYNIQAF
jgi:hypothetical protein